MSLRGALLRGPRNDAPVPMVSRSTGGQYAREARPRYRDETALGTYETVGTVFAIVHSLAVAVAQVDWHLYKTAKSGKKEDRTEVTKHGALDLWRMPNAFMPRRRFVETAQQHLDLTGESDILATLMGLGGKQIPTELWPVRPDRIVPVPDPEAFLKGYVYIAPDGEKVPLELNECLPILMPDPRNLYRGLGPIQSLLRTIGSVAAREEYDLAFYENSAEPGGIIQVPNTLSDPQFDELRARWAATHRGTGKAHRVAILENGMTWASNAATARDMQFAELRAVNRDTILEAFGYPKPMLGITEDVNRANAEAAEYVFSKWLITERLDRWRDWLNYQILPQYGNTGQGLEFDYDSPVSENSDAENAAITARSNALVAMAGAGFDVPETQLWLDVPEIGYEKPAPPPMLDPNGNGLNPDDPNTDDPSKKPKPGQQDEKQTPPNADPEKDKKDGEAVDSGGGAR